MARLRSVGLMVAAGATFAVGAVAITHTANAAVSDPQVADLNGRVLSGRNPAPGEFALTVSVGNSGPANIKRVFLDFKLPANVKITAVNGQEFFPDGTAICSDVFGSVDGTGRQECHPTPPGLNRSRTYVLTLVNSGGSVERGSCPFRLTAIGENDRQTVEPDGTHDVVDVTCSL